MFDRDSGRGILMGGMIRNYRIAEHNGQVADEALAENQRLRAYVKRLENEVTRLNRVAQDALMDASGRYAQVHAFMAKHPDSPLLRNSGKRFKDGDVKTESRIIYEKAYDAQGRKMDIAKPSERRAD